MTLTKWYADCVAPDGTVFLGYSARLRLGPFVVPYQSVTHGRPATPSVTRTSLRRAPLPAYSAGTLTWAAPRLDTDGVWRSCEAPPLAPRVLLEGGGLRIEWRCHVPAARTRIRIGSDHLEGNGYAEELIVQGDLRRLPITELRWGRAIAAGEWIVWIDGRGARPFRLIVHNGSDLDDGTLGADHITSGSQRRLLSLGETRVLREGPLSRTFFANRPWLARLLPRALNLQETKWLSRAELATNAGTVAGWAIHEVVRWP